MGITMQMTEKCNFTQDHTELHHEISPRQYSKTATTCILLKKYTLNSFYGVLYLGRFLCKLCNSVPWFDGAKQLAVNANKLIAQLKADKLLIVLPDFASKCLLSQL